MIRRFVTASLFFSLVGGSLASAATYKELLRDAHKGDAVAMRKVGYNQFSGKGGVTQNRKNGLGWLKLAAKKGDAQALYYLGCIYQKGEYVGVDLKEAESYFSKAAAKGHENAKKKLAEIRPKPAPKPAEKPGKAQDSRNTRLADEKNTSEKGKGKVTKKKDQLLSDEQNKLLLERAAMVDKSLPKGALCGDYFDFVRKNFARAKQYHYMPTQRGGEYGLEVIPMKENTPMIAYIREVEEHKSGLYLLCYLATKYERTLDAGNKDKIEAIYKDIQKIGLECSSIEDELDSYEEKAMDLGEKIFGSDILSDGVKTEALKYSWPMYALSILLYAREGCNILYRDGVGEMLEKRLSTKYGQDAVERTFKWKMCSLIDVFGGDVKLLEELPKLSNSEYRNYRSKLLTALKVKYQSSDAFRDHVSETLDMLRAKDGEDMLIVNKYITHLKRAHFINYMVPSLGQMCGIDF